MTGISPIGPQSGNEYVSSTSTSTQTESTPIDYQNRGSAAQASGEEIDAAQILGFERAGSTGETTSTAPTAAPRKSPAPATDEAKDYFTNQMTTEQRQELVDGVKTTTQNEIANRQNMLEQLYDDFDDANVDVDFDDVDMTLDEYVSFARKKENSFNEIMEKLSNITNFSDLLNEYETEAIVTSILMDRDNVPESELKERIQTALSEFSVKIKNELKEKYNKLNNISQSVQNDFSTLDSMAQDGTIEHLGSPTSQYFENALNRAYSDYNTTGIESAASADNPRKPDGAVKLLINGKVYIKRGNDYFDMSGRKVDLNN